MEIMALCASCYIKTEIPQIYNERIKNEIPPATISVEVMLNRYTQEIIDWYNAERPQMLSS